MCVRRDTRREPRTSQPDRCAELIQLSAREFLREKSERHAPSSIKIGDSFDAYNSISLAHSLANGSLAQVQTSARLAKWFARFSSARFSVCALAVSAAELALVGVREAA